MIEVLDEVASFHKIVTNYFVDNFQSKPIQLIVHGVIKYAFKNSGKVRKGVAIDLNCKDSAVRTIDLSVHHTIHGAYDSSRRLPTAWRVRFGMDRAITTW